MSVGTASLGSILREACLAQGPLDARAYTGRVHKELYGSMEEEEPADVNQEAYVIKKMKKIGMGKSEARAALVPILCDLLSTTDEVDSAFSASAPVSIISRVEDEMKDGAALSRAQFLLFQRQYEKYVKN